MIISFLVIYADYSRGPGKIDSYTWEAINFLKGNTSTESKILFFQSDVHNFLPIEKVFYNSQRQTYYITNSSEGVWLFYPQAYTDTGLVYKRSFFDFGSYLIDEPSIIKSKPLNFCDFDYIVFYNANPANIEQKSNLFTSLTSERHWSLTFNNILIRILKNDGGYCN